MGGFVAEVCSPGGGGGGGKRRGKKGKDGGGGTGKNARLCMGLERFKGKDTAAVNRRGPCEALAFRPKSSLE